MIFLARLALFGLNFLSFAALGADDCGQFFRSNPPLFKQTQDYTCGPASLLSWLRYKGINHFTEMEIASMLGTTESQGTTPQQFLDALPMLGMTGRFLNNLTIADLLLLHKEGKGIILDILSADMEPHWALVAKVDRDIVLMDPWEANVGYRVLTPETLNVFWRGNGTHRAALILE